MTGIDTARPAKTWTYLGLHPTILLLASTHFLVDGFGNLFTPLLPLFIPKLGLSLTMAGTLTMCFQLANSVSQLGFGQIADRWRPRVLLIGGPLVAVSLITLTGLATNVWMLAAALVAGGLGGAAFHPPAAALVHRFSGARKGLAMSFHISSGALGQAVAPLLFAPFAARYGLALLPILMVPGLALVGVLLRRMPQIERLQEKSEISGFRALRPYRKPLTLLYLIVVLRTMAALSFATFVPILLVRRGMSVAQAGTIVSAYMLATSVGNFLGGPLADLWGARRVIIGSLVAAVPFLVVAPTLTGWPFIVVLLSGGFLLQSTLSVNVTFAQMLAPISAATVSSLMMGFAWGTGGFSAPLAGMLADRIGIERTLMIVAFAPLAAAALALALPAGGRRGTPVAVRIAE